MRLVLLCIFVFFTYNYGYSQAVDSLAVYSADHVITLKEGKKAALEYSKTLKNNRLRIDIAKAGKKEAFSKYFPSVGVTGLATYGFEDFIEPIPQMLPEGIDNFYLAGANATQVIYAGGKIRTANKLAAMQVDVNRIRAEQSEDSVLLQTEQKYWNLVNLQEQQLTLQANVTLINQVLKQQEDMLEAGLIARNDLLKVKVRRSRLLLDESKLDNAHKVALLDFCLYTGIPYDTTLVMEDTLQTTRVPQIPFNGPDLSLRNNHSYQLLQKSVKSQKLQTQLSRGNYLPSLTAGIGAAQVGTFDDVIDNRFVPATFGTLSIPISDWWAVGRQDIKQEKIKEKIAMNQLKDGKDKLKVNIMKNWYDLEDARKRIIYAKENMELAEEDLKVSRDNYSSGLADITEVLDAQSEYQSAESEMVKAYGNYHTQMANYLHAIGELDY